MKEPTIKAVLIDDETSATENLTKIINRYCSGVEIIGSAHGVVQGIKTITSLQPDLVLLDIQMPDGTGFDMLECIEKRDFHVIFITSFNQHAIRAFKFSAMDYLLKPVDIDELVAAIERVRESMMREGHLDNFRELFDNLNTPNPLKLAVSSVQGKEYIDITSIIRLESSGSYTTVFTNDGKELVASRKIKDFEEILEGAPFLRIHNSHIINLYHVKRLTKSEGGWITLSDGAEVPLARRRKELFETVMSRLSSSGPSRQ